MKNVGDVLNLLFQAASDPSALKSAGPRSKDPLSGSGSFGDILSRLNAQTQDPGSSTSSNYSPEGGNIPSSGDPNSQSVPGNTPLPQSSSPAPLVQYPNGTRVSLSETDVTVVETLPSGDLTQADLQQLEKSVLSLAAGLAKLLDLLSKLQGMDLSKAQNLLTSFNGGRIGAEDAKALMGQVAALKQGMDPGQDPLALSAGQRNSLLVQMLQVMVQNLQNQVGTAPNDPNTSLQSGSFGTQAVLNGPDSIGFSFADIRSSYVSTNAGGSAVEVDLRMFSLTESVPQSVPASFAAPGLSGEQGFTRPQLPSTAVERLNQLLSELRVTPNPEPMLSVSTLSDVTGANDALVQNFKELVQILSKSAASRVVLSTYMKAQSDLTTAELKSAFSQTKTMGDLLSPLTPAVQVSSDLQVGQTERTPVTNATSVEAVLVRERTTSVQIDFAAAIPLPSTSTKPSPTVTASTSALPAGVVEPAPVRTVSISEFISIDTIVARFNAQAVRDSKTVNSGNDSARSFSNAAEQLLAGISDMTPANQVRTGDGTSMTALPRPAGTGPTAPIAPGEDIQIQVQPLPVLVEGKQAPVPSSVVPNPDNGVQEVVPATLVPFSIKPDPSVKLIDLAVTNRLVGDQAPETKVPSAAQPADVTTTRNAIPLEQPVPVPPVAAGETAVSADIPTLNTVRQAPLTAPVPEVVISTGSAVPLETQPRTVQAGPALLTTDQTTAEADMDRWTTPRTYVSDPVFVNPARLPQPPVTSAPVQTPSAPLTRDTQTLTASTLSFDKSALTTSVDSFKDPRMNGVAIDRTTAQAFSNEALNTPLPASAPRINVPVEVQPSQTLAAPTAPAPTVIGNISPLSRQTAPSTPPLVPADRVQTPLTAASLELQANQARQALAQISAQPSNSIAQNLAADVSAAPFVSQTVLQLSAPGNKAVNTGNLTSAVSNTTETAVSQALPITFQAVQQSAQTLGSEPVLKTAQQNVKPTLTNTPALPLNADFYMGEPSAINLNNLSASVSQMTQASQQSDAASLRILHQVTDQIAEHAGKSQMVTKLDFQLIPESLGRVTVSIVLADQALSARIVVSNPEVREVLQHHLVDLKASLSQAGLNIDHLEVHVQGGSANLFAQYQQYQQEGFGYRGSEYTPPTYMDEPLPTENSAISESLSKSLLLVDMLA